MQKAKYIRDDLGWIPGYDRNAGGQKMLPALQGLSG